MSDERQHAHDLIDQLAEWQLPAVVGVLKVLVDPVEDALRAAPEDDEPETYDEKQAIAEARDWLARNGKGIPHEEAMGELRIK